ncbi:tyrosine-type recombinase/integrase [Prauserella muralis]|uniref:tyrosine-type recombinase/integrase n=1 Tax=Prauserella muralis TaxID=588067 RepID=UPI000DD324BD|nr:tyrosine-type recombinase/integrase [Prauserella muralis]
MPASRESSWTVLGDDDTPIEPIERYLAYLTDIERSPNTIKAYAHDLKNYWQFLFHRGLDWREARLEDVGEFVAWLQLPPAGRSGAVAVLPAAAAHVGAATVNRKLAAVSAFYAHQARNGAEVGDLLAAWKTGGRGGWKPFLHHVSKGKPYRGRAISLKVPKKLPRVLTAVEMQAILDACTRLRDRLFFAVLHETGCRAGEVLGLRHEDIAAAERMIPIDDEILGLVDHIIAIRSHGRPMPHPRYRRPAQFLFTHHGRRLGQTAVRAELDRAAHAAGLDHVTPHQLRHTYATALVNAGVSLQALMALLGHVSAEMSLRYGRLFDTTVRAEYERALDLAKQQARTPASGAISLPLADITGGADWKDTPLLKSRLAGGFCLRAPAQGACSYANICEHCPSFHTEASSLPILAAQRVDAEALARDAEQRGWITEAERHQRLVARLDTLITKAEAG